MGCRKCGCPTPNRVCNQCRLADKWEEQYSNVEVFDCPTCDRPTSGEGVECRHCRSGGE